MPNINNLPGSKHFSCIVIHDIVWYNCLQKMGNLQSLQGSSKFRQNSSLSGTKDLLTSENYPKAFSERNPKNNCKLCCFRCSGLTETAYKQFANLYGMSLAFWGSWEIFKGKSALSWLQVMSDQECTRASVRENLLSSPKEAFSRHVSFTNWTWGFSKNLHHFACFFLLQGSSGHH